LVTPAASLAEPPGPSYLRVGSRSQPGPARAASASVTLAASIAKLTRAGASPGWSATRRRRVWVWGAQAAAFPLRQRRSGFLAALRARELWLTRRDTPPELASGPSLDHNI